MPTSPQFLALKHAARAGGCTLTLIALAASMPARGDTVFSVTAQQGATGIEQALAAARAARRSGTGLTAPVRVVLEPGEYTLSTPLRIGSDDTGTPAAPLVIEARVPGSVLISGAPRLRAAKLDTDPWRFTPPQPLTPDAEASGGQFYVNGKRATLARTPNAGSMWLLAGGDGDSLNATPEDATRLAADLADDTGRAIIHLMQSWTSGKHHVASYNAGARRLQLLPKPRWGFLKFGPKQRYYLENVPAALDDAGEWIANGGTLQYKPTAADLSSARTAAPTAYWPRLPQLLLVQGTPDQPVRHVQIRGLTFAYSGVPLPAAGWTDNQAATGVAAAIEVNQATNLLFTHNAMQHLGGYAIWLREGVSNANLNNNLLEDLGAGGVRIGTETTPGPRNRSANNTVQHNVVRDIGRDFPGAVGIWVGRSFGNNILSNVVARTTYTGISVGWSWGYDDPSSGNNTVADNLLYDIGQQQLSDMGGIYTLGRSPGTVVRGNYVHSVEDFVGYGAGAWGIYNDEGSADMLVENNVVVGTRSGGYQLHYGRDLTVRNNLFAGGRSAEVRWANVARSGEWKFEGNGIGNPTEANTNKRISDTAAGPSKLTKQRPDFEWHGTEETSRSQSLPPLNLRAGAMGITTTIGSGLFEFKISAAGKSTPEQQDTWKNTLAQSNRLYTEIGNDNSKFPWLP